MLKISTLLTSAVLSISTQAFAREVWFGITGINQRNPRMNYASFYDESNAFLEACKRNPNRDCRRYINPNTSLAAERSARIVGANNGTPTSNRSARDGVLADIRRTIQNARAGDRIVISLNNHGGPGWDSARRDTSCIFVRNREKICDSDLARIIGDLPRRRGFQVAVIAEGCFSGGFNKLANRNVCVATTSDQQRAAYGGRFWRSVVETNPSTLAEAGALYNNGGNPYDHTMLASQYMDREDGCRETRRIIGNRSGLPRDLINRSPLRFTHDQLCTTNSGYRQLNELNESMKYISAQLASPANLQRVCAASREWCSTMQNVVRNQNAFTQTQEYTDIMAQIRALKTRIDGHIEQLYRNASRSEIQLISLYVNYGDTSALNRLSPARRAALQPQLNAYNSASAANSAEINRLYTRLGDLTKEWQRSPIAQDLRRIAACLSAPLPGYTNDRMVHELERQARTRRQLRFTDRDKREAEACEQSFRL